jgi:hypothetical protein
MILLRHMFGIGILLFFADAGGALNLHIRCGFYDIDCMNVAEGL